MENTNVLKPCPVSWCKRDDAPHTWQDCADTWAVVCPSCSVDGPSAVTESEAVDLWNGLTRATITDKEVVSVLRDIIANANEAPRYGPFDQVDNDGQAYQSADFEKALKAGRDLLSHLSRDTDRG